MATIVVLSSGRAMRSAATAADDASLQTRRPYKAAYEHDLAWLCAAMVKHYRGDDGDLELLMASAAAFFAEAEHPTLGRPYRECGCRPMVELLRHLEANGFEKPVRIRSRVGRRPSLSGGNSNAEREFDYTAGAEDALAEDGVTVVSVKRDWAEVFT